MDAANRMTTNSKLAPMAMTKQPVLPSIIVVCSMKEELDIIYNICTYQVLSIIYYLLSIIISIMSSSNTVICNSNIYYVFIYFDIDIIII